jgi:hypothetical protein
VAALRVFIGKNITGSHAVTGPSEERSRWDPRVFVSVIVSRAYPGQHLLRDGGQSFDRVFIEAQASL